MFLSMVTFYFGLLSAIAFTKTKLNYVYKMLGERSINRGQENKTINASDQKVAVQAAYLKGWPLNRWSPY